MAILVLIIMVIAAGQAEAQGIGAVLGWKFGHPNGLVTKNDRVEAWPDVLGPRPTQQQIETWRQEYRQSEDWRDVQDFVEFGETTTDEARALFALTEALVEAGFVPLNKVPAQTLKRINRRRARRGKAPL